MAVAVATVTVASNTSTWIEGGIFNCIGTVAISPSPATYTTGGISMPLQGGLIKASRKPVRVSVTGINGYTYQYVNGTDNSNGTLKIFVQDAVSQDPLVELTNASAIPANVSGDTISVLAQFLGQN
jgi:hypothetical protein